MSIANRVKEVTNSTSTAVIVLGGAPLGYRAFAALPAEKRSNLEVMVGPDSAGAWLLGLFDLTSDNTLTRTAIGDSSTGGDVTLAAGTKDVFNTISSATLAGFSSVRDIPFSAVIPLSVVGESFMAQATASAGLTFTAAAAVVRGALVYLRLVGDGANTPIFSGMKQWGGSQDFDPRNGVENQIQFFCDGPNVFYSISQAVGAAPVPTKPGAPIIGAASAGDGNASVAFTAPASDGGAAITGYSVTAYKASDNSVARTITVTSSPASFQGLANGMAVYFKAAATNSAGTGLQSAASNTVTPAVAAVTYTRLNSLTSVTETGSGPYSYAYSGSGGGWLDGSGGVSNQLAANTDGSIAMTINVVAAANGLLLAVSSGSAKVPYTGTLYAVYVNDSDGKYKTITGGNPGTSTASGVAAQVGDILRLRRTGTSLVAEAARAATPTTWTTLRTWTGVTTAAVYFQVDISGAGSVGQNITGVGV